MGTSERGFYYGNDRWDHPHAYGDKITFRDSLKLLPGSSPRVWGQALGVEKLHLAYGIIPTRMGTSTYSSDTPQGSLDHPHAYGDKRATFLVRIPSLGSSPRVWGQEILSLS